MAKKEKHWGGRTAIEWAARMTDAEVSAHDRSVAATMLREMLGNGLVTDRATIAAVVKKLAVATHAKSSIIRQRAYGALNQYVLKLNHRLSDCDDTFDRASAAYLIRVVAEYSADRVAGLELSVPVLIMALQDTKTLVQKQAGKALQMLSPTLAKKHGV